VRRRRKSQKKQKSGSVDKSGKRENRSRKREAGEAERKRRGKSEPEGAVRQKAVRKNWIGKKGTGKMGPEKWDRKKRKIGRGEEAGRVPCEAFNEEGLSDGIPIVVCEGKKDKQFTWRIILAGGMGRGDEGHRTRDEGWGWG
jgi:hypothetical protein